MVESNNPPMRQISDHLVEIRRCSDRRLRLVMICKLTVPINVTPAVVCARSEQCAMCQKVLDELREIDFRIVDVGVLSPVEVQRVGFGETTAPAAPK